MVKLADIANARDRRALVTSGASDWLADRITLRLVDRSISMKRRTEGCIMLALRLANYIVKFRNCAQPNTIRTYAIADRVMSELLVS